MPKEMSRVKLAIAVPTYNEALNIPKLVKKLKHVSENNDIDCTLLIIDDNSPDGTGKVVDKLAKSEHSKTFKIEAMHRTQKNGLGKAYIDGFKKLLKKDYSHILQMDADLSHDPKYLPQFIKATKTADFVVGSRYVKGGSTPDWSWNRKLQSRGGNLYTRLLLGSKITDYTGGFNLYSTDLMRKIDLDKLRSGGYGFLIELKYEAIQNSTGISQVPIVFTDRVHGVSKIPKSTLINNLLLIPRLRLNSKQKAK